MCRFQWMKKWWLNNDVIRLECKQQIGPILRNEIYLQITGMEITSHVYQCKILWNIMMRKGLKGIKKICEMPMLN